MQTFKMFDNLCATLVGMCVDYFLKIIYATCNFSGYVQMKNIMNEILLYLMKKKYLLNVITIIFP